LLFKACFAVYGMLCCLWHALLFMACFAVYGMLCCLWHALLFMACFAVYGYFWHDTSLLNAAGVTLGKF
jgi:hypothetical protein